MLKIEKYIPQNTDAPSIKKEPKHKRSVITRRKIIDAAMDAEFTPHKGIEDRVDDGDAVDILEGALIVDAV